MPAHEQFEAWQDAVDRAFVPVGIVRPRAGAFLSTISERSLGPVQLSQIAAPAQSVHRTGAHVARDEGDVCFLNLPLTGGASASQDGRTASLSAGDFAIVDSTRPFELDFQAPFRQVSLKLPREMLAPTTAALDVTGMRVHGDRGLGAVASAAVRAAAVAGGPIDRQGARMLGEQLVSLIALALGGLRAAPGPASRAMLLSAVLDAIERSLHDPKLSPSRVADMVGISNRYLHRLLSEQGASFGQRVLARRLERSRRDLMDPGRGHLTVSQIAYGQGFADPSYFTRAFKRRYGMTPTQLRLLATR